VWTSGATNCLHTDMDADAVERLRALIRVQQATCAEDTAAAAAAVSAAPVGSSDAAVAQQGGRQKGLVSAFVNNSSTAAPAAATTADVGISAVPCNRSTSWLSPSVHVAVETPAAAAAVPAHAPNSSSSSVIDSSKGSSGWTIIPDTPSSSFLKWTGPLVDDGVRLFADLPAWMSQ
jgi:hypothetical protein